VFICCAFSITNFIFISYFNRDFRGFAIIYKNDVTERMMHGTFFLRESYFLFVFFQCTLKPRMLTNQKPFFLMA